MLTIHHLQVSQSDRVVFLCEELEIPYELKIYQRAPYLAPKEFQDLHPIGAAPVIQDGDVTLAETSAIVEYIIHKHGDGRLTLPSSHKDYATYLYWLHFSNGTLQPGISRVGFAQMAGADPENFILKAFTEKRDKYLRYFDTHVKDNTWLAGEEFTCADIMASFSLTTNRYFSQYSLADYPNILAYIKRLTSRPAYQRYLKKADPELKVPLEAAPPPPFMKS